MAGETTEQTRSCLGISARNWGIILGCLLSLYLFLGLYYYALITIAVDVRGAEYMKLPTAYFGDFDRDEYYFGYGSVIDKKMPVYPWIWETSCKSSKWLMDGDEKMGSPYTDVCYPECTNPIYGKCVEKECDVVCTLP